MTNTNNKVSIYLSEPYLSLARKAAVDKGVSLSKFTTMAVRDALVRNKLNLDITDAAFLSLAEGDTAAITAVTGSQGETLVSTVSFDTGNQAKLDDLNKYISGEEYTFLKTWNYDETGSPIVHLFYEDGSEVIIGKDRFDKSFKTIIEVSKQIVLRDFGGKVVPKIGEPSKVDLANRVKVSEDENRVYTIRKALKENGGYCPCRFEKTDDTVCMCKEFREQITDPNFHGPCHCGLYYVP